MAYILLDVIGIKELLESDRAKAEELCQEFWKQSKIEALYGGDGFSRYITFSDSLLIYRDNDKVERGKSLIDWANREYGRFKNKLSVDFCMIINIGDELKPDIDHEMISVETSFDDKPFYIHIAGLGSDFADLFYAEKEIKDAIKAKKLRKDLRIYINEELLDGYCNNGQQLPVKGLYGEIVFYGFPWINLG